MTSRLIGVSLAGQPFQIPRDKVSVEGHMTTLVAGPLKNQSLGSCLQALRVPTGKLVGGGRLTPRRDAVGVSYCPNRQGESERKTLARITMMTCVDLCFTKMTLAVYWNLLLLASVSGEIKIAFHLFKLRTLTENSRRRRRRRICVLREIKNEQFNVVIERKRRHSHSFNNQREKNWLPLQSSSERHTIQPLDRI